MATPNVAEPGMPKVWRVLKGFESVSTIEIVLLAELEVRIAPVCGFSAAYSEKGRSLLRFPPKDVSKPFPFGARVPFRLGAGEVKLFDKMPRCTI